MFDPTIYDNLKVSLEGAVYEYDFAENIRVTGRQDRVELSDMSRCFSVAFRLNAEASAEAEIRLSAGAGDLAAEILELRDVKPGCRLEICFSLDVTDVESDCGKIAGIVEKIWGGDYPLRQTLSFEYTAQEPRYRNRALLSFNQKFGEEIIADFPRFVEHTVRTLQELS